MCYHFNIILNLQHMKKYTDEAWLRDAYITKELSIAAIATICGVSITLPHRYLIKFNIPRRKFCGRKGILCGKYKGGRVITTQGYVHLLSPGHPRAFKPPNHAPYVPEQVLVVEKILGRYLDKKEFIHHINEIKTDNRPENLYLFSSSAEHSRYHLKLRKGTSPLITQSNIL